MFYSNLAYAFIIVFFIYKLIKKDFNLFHVLIFVLPFHSWMYRIGLNLTISQIVTLIMIFTTVILMLKKKKNIFNFGNQYIVFFLLFAIVNTVIMSVFFIDEFLQLGGYFRSEGRFISQIVLLLINFSIIPLLFNYIKNIQDVQKYLKIYLYALILLVMLGWVQYFTYVLTGVDLFPLNIDEIGNIKTGIYQYKGMDVVRISSLGGEPKGFSMSLVIGFFIIHIFNKYGISFFKYDIVLKYLFVFTSFSTLSTSGMILFAVLFAVYLFHQIMKSEISFKVDYKNILYFFMMIGIIGFLLFEYQDFILTIVQERILDRDIASEDFDAPIQILLSEYPEYLILGSGLGNIHNLAYPYISLQTLHYMGDSIFLAKSGYLRMFSELGLIGFSLFGYMFYSVYLKLGEVSKYFSLTNRQVFKAMQLLLFIVLMAYLARVYVNGELMIFLAIANVLGYLKTN